MNIGSIVIRAYFEESLLFNLLKELRQRPVTELLGRLLSLNFGKAHPPYTVRVHGRRRRVEIVGWNWRTVIVRLRDGSLIKRHIEKHGLKRGRRNYAIS